MTKTEAIAKIRLCEALADDTRAPEGERNAARAMADKLKVTFKIGNADMLSDDDLLRNPPDGYFFRDMNTHLKAIEVEINRGLARINLLGPYWRVRAMNDFYLDVRARIVSHARHRYGMAYSYVDLQKQRDDAVKNYYKIMRATKHGLHDLPPQATPADLAFEEYDVHNEALRATSQASELPKNSVESILKIYHKKLFDAYAKAYHEENRPKAEMAQPIDEEE